MQFKPELAALVMAGTKRQTRRPVKPGQELLITDMAGGYRGVACNGRNVYEVGKDYAVCPGRGKHAVGRILITEIRQEDVREIEHEDVIAEGFQHRGEFFEVWTNFYDPVIAHQFYAVLEANRNLPGIFEVWDTMIERMATRPADLYLSWALTFEVVK